MIKNDKQVSKNISERINMIRVWNDAVFSHELDEYGYSKLDWAIIRMMDKIQVETRLLLLSLTQGEPCVTYSVLVEYEDNETDLIDALKHIEMENEMIKERNKNGEGHI